MGLCLRDFHCLLERRHRVEESSNLMDVIGRKAGMATGEAMEHAEHKESAVVSWIIIGLICLWVFAWGFFLFFGIGSKERPGWNYRTIRDVPALSEYSTARSKPLPPTATGLPELSQSLTPPEAQHVSRPETPFQEMIRKEAMQ